MGAPHDSKAGVLLLTPLKTEVKKGDVLFRIYAETEGELNYAVDYLKTETSIILIL